MCENISENCEKQNRYKRLTETLIIVIYEIINNIRKLMLLLIHILYIFKYLNIKTPKSHIFEEIFNEYFTCNE